MTPNETTSVANHSKPKRVPSWLWAGLVALALGLAAVVFIAGHDLLELISVKTLGLNYDTLKHHVADHPGLAVLAYFAAYALLGVLLLPGSALLVVAGGLFFGIGTGIAISALASTLAAMLAFSLARTVFGKRLAGLSNPAFQHFRAGFARHALSYMMFLRLTPGLSFAAINVIPGLIGVPFSAFAIGTFVGLFPSRIALSTAGAGLAHAIDVQNTQYWQCLARAAAPGEACPYEIHIGSLLTPQTLAAFVALAVLALIPAMMDAAPRVWQRFRARSRL